MQLRTVSSHSHRVLQTVSPMQLLQQLPKKSSQSYCEFCQGRARARLAFRNRSYTVFSQYSLHKLKQSHITQCLCFLQVMHSHFEIVYLATRLYCITHSHLWRLVWDFMSGLIVLCICLQALFFFHVFDSTHMSFHVCVPQIFM